MHYLFSGSKSIHNLALDAPNSREAYARFILALFKKNFATKLRINPVELFDENTDIVEVLETVIKNMSSYNRKQHHTAILGMSGVKGFESIFLIEGMDTSHQDHNRCPKSIGTWLDEHR